jgi:transcriptional regulator with XRE-family HTH domain
VLQELRHEAGLTQEALGARIGMEFTRIGELERGMTDPRLRTLRRLAWGLDVSLEEIARRFEQRLREESPSDRT